MLSVAQTAGLGLRRYRLCGLQRAAICVMTTSGSPSLWQRQGSGLALACRVRGIRAEPAGRS